MAFCIILQFAFCSCPDTWLGDRCQFPHSVLQLPALDRQNLLAGKEILLKSVIHRKLAKRKGKEVIVFSAVTTSFSKTYTFGFGFVCN